MNFARDLRGRRCWIFDLDGTLTKPVHDFERIRRQLTVPADEGILEYIARQAEPERERLEKALSAIEFRLAAQAQASQDVCALLGYLADQGALLGILTRNMRGCVPIILERLAIEHFFAGDDILAREDCLPKPDPEGVNTLLRGWQADPADAVMVGDFRYDLECGRRAGVATVHYNALGRDGWPALTDIEVSSFAALLAVLQVN